MIASYRHAINKVNLTTTFDSHEYPTRTAPYQRSDFAYRLTRYTFNHVPTLVDVYTVDTLKEWFEIPVLEPLLRVSRQACLATGLLLSINKNRLTSLGSNFTDYKKLGFKDQDALGKTHKSIDLKYLRQLNRMAMRLLHDAVFETSDQGHGNANQTQLHFENQ